MDPTTKHPKEQVLGAWLDGELGVALGESVEPGELEAVEAHLADCPECAARLESLRGLGVGVSAWAQEGPEPAMDFADAVLGRLDEAYAAEVPANTEAEAEESTPPLAPVVPLHRPGRPILPWSMLALAAAAVLVLGLRQLGRSVEGPQSGRDATPRVATHRPEAGLAREPDEEPAQPGSAVVEVALEDATKEDYKVFEIQGQSRGTVLSVVWIDDRTPEDRTPEEGNGEPESNGQPEPQENRVQ